MKSRCFCLRAVLSFLRLLLYLSTVGRLPVELRFALVRRLSDAPELTYVFSAPMRFGVNSLELLARYLG